MPAATPKDGASRQACPRQGCRHIAGSRDDMPVSSKIRALFDVLGPCIVRTCDGGTHVLSAEALRVVNIPLSHSTASNPGAKQHHA